MSWFKPKARYRVLYIEEMPDGMDARLRKTSLMTREEAYIYLASFPDTLELIEVTLTKEELRKKQLDDYANTVYSAI